MPDTRRVDFQDIKSRADFRAILAHYHIAVVGQGDQAKIRCPFHDDHDPSCSVNLVKGVFNCHACHHAGNVLDFVHRMETKDGTKASLRQVGLLIAQICGIELNESPAPKGARKPQDGPSPRCPREGAGRGMNRRVRREAARGCPRG
jgi:DNA primase